MRRWIRNKEAGITALGVLVIMAIIIVIIAAIMALSVAIVPAGHVGVHDLFGEASAQELYPGLHFKHPMACVAMMSTKTQEYTMTYTQGEGAKKQSDTITALTKEGLKVDLDITILYRLEGQYADEVYKNIGTNYVDIIVRPQIRTAIREVVARYEAKQIYSEDRENMTMDIFDFLEADLLPRHIVLEDVLIRNVQLPDQLTIAIEEKLTAEQQIEKRRFEVEVETQEANRKRVEAQGIADSNEIIANSLTQNYLTWYWIQNLDSHNSVIYVPIGESGLPLFKSVD